MPPSAKGRIFYNDALTGFNYDREKAPLTQVLERIAKYAGMQNPPAVAAQSALLADCVPAFAQENVLPLLSPAIKPRIWLGSAVVTPAHFDESSNVACVVAGRRRFTLLPPEQVVNLYIGPLDLRPRARPSAWCPSASPTSSASRASARRLPPRAWPSSGRATRSTSRRSGGTTWIARAPERAGELLVEGLPDAGRPPSAFGALHQAVKTFEHASAEQRAAWEALFGHFVFRRETGETGGETGV